MTDAGQSQPVYEWRELEPQLKGIAGQFQVGRVDTITVHPTEEGLESGVPDVFVVDSTYSGKDARWLLKRHRSGKGWERLAVEQELACGLNQVGFKLIPPAVPTRGGQMHAEALGQLWAVYPFLQGQSLPMFGRRHWTPAKAAALGSELARLHIGGCGVTEHMARWRELPDLSVKLSGQAVMVWFDRLIGTVRERRLDDPDDPVLKFFAFASERPDRRLEKALSQIDRWQGESPSVLVHGDLHPANLLYTGDTLTGIIDLEFARLDSPLFDLGYFNFFLLGSDENVRAGSASDQPSPDEQAALLRRLLDTYMEQWPDGRIMAELSRVQVEERLPVYTLLAGILSTCWFLERYLATGLFATRLSTSAALLKFLFHYG